MRHAPAALILGLALAACAEDGDYPTLLPTALILAEPALPVHAGPLAADPAPVQAATDARADALRARAEALRAPVVDPALRGRAGA